MKKHYNKIPLLFVLSGCLMLLIGGTDCSKNRPTDTGERTAMAKRDINVVKEAHVKELMALPGVVGVYVGTLDEKTPCIGVMVEHLTPELKKKIPKELEGYPVRIDETGVIRPMK